MTSTVDEPVTLLIGALGGEGGGVLTNWVTSAGAAAGLAVQSTSVPGVAQRTGATAYYVEMAMAPKSGPAPVFALFPNPGMVDLMIASELMEAGRAMERGFVTPDRTTLIASTHRIYAIGEKSSPSDGRFNADRVVKAADSVTKTQIMFDMAAAARDNATTLNAIALGCIAGSGRLPITRDAFEDAIRATGKAVDANLRGFVCGFEAAIATGRDRLPQPPVKRRTIAPPAAEGPLSRAQDSYPPELRDTVSEAVARLTEYQSRSHATCYLQRLDRIYDQERAAEGDAFGYRVTQVAARQLAVWMSYEDVIRVADLKTRSSRLTRVRDEIGAEPATPIRVTEFLKPGVEEWCGMLPAFIGGPVQRWAERTGRLDRFNLVMHVQTTSVLGYVRLYLLGRLRWWRPFTLRFKMEELAVEAWLDHLLHAQRLDYRLAAEVATLPNIRKGYGETRRRGVDKYTRIINTLVRPTLAGHHDPTIATERLTAAIAQARTDSDDAAFDVALNQLESPTPERRDAAE